MGDVRKMTKEVRPCRVLGAQLPSAGAWKRSTQDTGGLGGAALRGLESKIVNNALNCCPTLLFFIETFAGPERFFLPNFYFFPTLD